MSVFAEETLPETLAARLTDEQRQAVNDAPRGARLAALGAALGMAESEALALLAASVSLDIASNLETDPEARGILPPASCMISK